MEEKILQTKKNGMVMLLLTLLGYVVFTALFVYSLILLDTSLFPGILLMVLSILYWVAGIFLFCGLKVLKPQEALVLTLFGDYIGTLKGQGFYWVNPFCTAVNPAAGTKLSQSGDVNSSETGMAALLKAGSGSALRNVVRVYPYDVAPNVDTTGDGVADEGSLRGSSEVVAARIRDEIQKNVEQAGIEVVEARITYLAYAPEIAAVMLQRQQASAIIDARKMIVDGAVGMVEMALDRLSENKVVELDDERKAAMVSNLLVVLCGNRDAQPIVNSGSLY